MPRAERLQQLSDILRSGEATTVRALARDLNVSTRTVLRDLGSLRERGVPITGEAGRGGGVRLEYDRGVAAVHLSIPEVVAMWLASRLSREGTDLPWGAASRSGLAKLFSCLPRPKARQLRSLCRRVIIGPPASNFVRGSAGAPPSELLSLFELAFTRGLGLGFEYTDRDGRRSVRRIEPHGLLVEPPVWYVLARDLDRAASRMFRMDRVTRPRLLRDVVFGPDPAVIDAQIPDQARWRPLTRA
jgi:predicted DNA-binding transcriptional regulator YafY